MLIFLQSEMDDSALAVSSQAIPEPTDARLLKVDDVENFSSSKPHLNPKPQDFNYEADKKGIENAPKPKRKAAAKKKIPANLESQNCNDLPNSAFNKSDNDSNRLDSHRFDSLCNNSLSSTSRTTKVVLAKKVTVASDSSRDSKMVMEVEEAQQAKSKKRSRVNSNVNESPAKRKKTEKRSKDDASPAHECPCPLVEPEPPKQKVKRKVPEPESDKLESVQPKADSVSSRKLVLSKVHEGVLADFEIVDPRRIGVDEASAKKKKFAPASLLTLALRLLADKSFINNEGLLLKSNVFVKPSILAGFSVHVYGADQNTRAVYSGSLFDSSREGFSIYVHNLGASRQVNAGEIVAFLELRSNDDRLKIKC